MSPQLGNAKTVSKSLCLQVDSTGVSVTDSMARVSRNPEHAQLLSEHRRLERGRKELENQVSAAIFNWHIPESILLA